MTVIDVTEETFQAEVVDRSKTTPVVVDFWAAWCGPCRALTPILEKAVTARNGEVELAKLDTDANPRLSAAFRIQGIPAVKAFKDGRVVSEFTGAQPPARVAQFLDALVPSEAEQLVAAGVAAFERGDADAALARGRVDDARVRVLRAVELNRRQRRPEGLGVE